MWIVEYDDNGNDEHEITIWNSEDDALKYAKDQIILHINAIYFIQDPDLIRAVGKFNYYLEANSLKLAIDYWNNCDYNINCNAPAYWEVSESLTKVYRGNGAVFDTKRYPFLIKVPPPTPSAGGLINNHTCVQCGNTRLNKKEKSCWSCGTKI